MDTALASTNTCVIQTQGIAASLGGNHPGCAQGPITLRDSVALKDTLEKNGISLNWQSMLTPNPQLELNSAIKNLCGDASKVCQNFLKNNHPFLFFSGEHAYAMGIWKGAIKALAKRDKTLALIWIDAHMDAHTFLTSPSGNVHGMPVAALLGAGDEKLNGIYNSDTTIQANQLALLGVRSFEKAEQSLLNNLDVSVVYMKDLATGPSLSQQLKVLRDTLLQKADYFAISLDMDAIDPSDAPAVGVPEALGLSGVELCEALKQFNGDKRLLGMEISEYSPEFDQQKKTQQLISKLLSAVYGRS